MTLYAYIYKLLMNWVGTGAVVLKSSKSANHFMYFVFMAKQKACVS